MREEIRIKIIERCGNDYIADGIICPNCGCFETYKNSNDPNNTDKWFFLISAFKVDNDSHCSNCDSWFEI